MAGKVGESGRLVKNKKEGGNRLQIHEKRVTQESSTRGAGVKKGGGAGLVGGKNHSCGGKKKVVEKGPLTGKTEVFVEVGKGDRKKRKTGR